MFIPYQVDVPMSRWPISNFVLMGVIIGSSMVEILRLGLPWGEALVLDGWSLWGLAGHVFLHADLIHLVGNMIFLWVFGNAVCAKIGNIAYVFVFAGLAIASGTVHNWMDGSPAIGASGAINGIVGMYLIYYPLNDVSCFSLLGFHGVSFSVSSVWMILLWVAFDILGAVLGLGSVAYWAHLGGIAAGAGIAAVVLALGWVQMDPSERSLFDVLTGRNQVPFG